MRVFVACSYASKVNYVSGEVFDEYREWLDAQVDAIEQLGHEVFCALRSEGYKINNVDPAAAIRMDLDEIDKCDVVVAFTSSDISAGVQMEIGYAIAKLRRVIVAHEADSKIGWTNAALDKANLVEVVPQPFDPRLI